jgi:glycosyltransferase involved in cell wall biosynthesis
MARWYSANRSRYHQLLAALRRRGHDVFVLQPPPLPMAETNYIELQPKQADDLRIEEVPVWPSLWRRRFPLEKLVKKGLYTVACRHQVAMMIEHHAIDVMLIYNLPQHLLLQHAPCLRVFDIADDLPAMLRHEMGATVGPVAERLARAWQRRLIAQCDVITVASHVLQDQIGSRAILIPNGIQPDEVRAADGAAVRRRLTGPIVGYLGALEYFVDLDMILAVAARLPEVTFLLVGGGRDLHRLRRRVETIGLRNVLMPGPVTHARGLDYVAAMDVCLIPFRPGAVSDSACPLKLFEYAALRKPIISTRTVEMTRIAGDYVFFADSADELYTTIRQLLEMPEVHRELLERACARVYQEYTWDRIADAFVDAIESGSTRRGMK